MGLHKTGTGRSGTGLGLVRDGYGTDKRLSFPPRGYGGTGHYLMAWGAMIFFYVKKNHDPLLYKGKNYNPLMAEKNNEPHPIGPLF